MALVDVESRVTPALTLQLKGASDLERRGRPARRALFGLMLSLATRAVEAQKTPSGSPPTMQAPKPDRPAESRPAPARATSVLVASGPAYHASPPPTELEQEFQRKQYKRDPKSGNYLAPKVFTKTLNEPLVQVRIGGRWMTDLKGQPVFLRESIRNKLLEADEAMFKKRQQHIVVNYGFRSNAVQQELFRRINGKGAVARKALRDRLIATARGAGFSDRRVAEDRVEVRPIADDAPTRRILEAGSAEVA